ncbi:hydroxypyruvate isomerase [Paramicrobacterium humi]|uniref:Hydroxypyruvate isomerase n=1 Tax=Paramicrobacterium humi TaxID=640635 RepID=A0A1H4L6N0_9MICO|nr:TIM barrel protein [Microbacterium humi]SEB66420.1 hydroxypyruvate isomerase [Microbacterium humi]
MTERVRWIANLSLLFTEIPLLDRPAAAKAAGFDEVEFWWPFGTEGRPRASEIERFTNAVLSAGVQLAAMNLFGGDMQAGERGVLSYPERTEEFRESVRIAAHIGELLGTRLFNAPYGHRREGLPEAVQDALADESLAFASSEIGKIGGTVLLEPISGMPLYPMKLPQDAFAVIDRLRESKGITNLGFLLDQYHLENQGVDLLTAIDDWGEKILHVQLADVPGRGEPGSGAAQIGPLIERLRGSGYTGAFALEYIPTTDTATSLVAWERERSSWGV